MAQPLAVSATGHSTSLSLACSGSGKSLARNSVAVVQSGPSIGSAGSALGGLRLISSKSSQCAASKRSGLLVVRIDNAANPKSVEKVDWKTKRENLLKKGVRSIPPKEALRLQKEQGYIILDVRPKYEHEEVCAEGSMNAEMYRLIKEWTAWDNLRRAGFAFFGVFKGTEENPDFLQEVEALGLTKDSKIITACSFGGTTKPTQNFSEGKESRSLIAAYLLTMEGYKNVYHLDGGLSTWFREEYPVTFKED